MVRNWNLFRSRSRFFQKFKMELAFCWYLTARSAYIVPAPYPPNVTLPSQLFSAFIIMVWLYIRSNISQDHCSALMTGSIWAKSMTIGFEMKLYRAKNGYMFLWSPNKLPYNLTCGSKIPRMAICFHASHCYCMVTANVYCLDTTFLSPLVCTCISVSIPLSFKVFQFC